MNDNRTPVYCQDDVADAPHGTVRFANTDIEVVAYQTGDALCLIVNKRGLCIYRASLRGALQLGLKPSLNPLHNDAFIVRDLGGGVAAVQHVDARGGDGSGPTVFSIEPVWFGMRHRLLEAGREIGTFWSTEAAWDEADKVLRARSAPAQRGIACCKGS